MAERLPRKAGIVIIGGGVMGASSAYHLALGGAKDVLLLERASGFGLGTTGRCAGGVRHQFGTEINVQLSILSLGMLERFRAETGQDCNYRKCGYLFVLTNETDVEAFKRNIAMQHRLGVATEWLSGEEIRRRLPLMLFDDALGGSFYPEDGLVDPNSVVMGYINRARRLGVSTLTDLAVTGIEMESGRITCVTTNKGTVSCGTVVNAAGPWASLIGQMVGLEIPIQPIRRQMVTTTPLSELPPDFPFVIDFAQSLYFHREGEGILTGMSNPDEEPGFDQATDSEWELVSLQAATERMPILAHAGRLSGWAGLYEVTPDAHPIIGPTPVEGFWVVAGFSG